ncbi:MAG TPA: hypothetical protein VM759_09100, partial [Longimicrobium sp.]|nr:hypothetical protein [Longimicrobium sp.]
PYADTGTPSFSNAAILLGVGSSLLGHSKEDNGLLSDFDFTADLVRVDGKEEGKVGRTYRDNPRLVRLDWDRV